MDREDDAIRRVLAGDREAFRSLVERHQAAVLAVARNLLADAGDAEDLAQETFLAAFRKLGSYDAARGAFSNWLLRIARNLTLNALRKQRPRTLGEVSPDVFPAPPGREIEAAEAARLLDRALAALPFEQRSAFVLADIHGLTYEEVGRIEGLAMGTVKSRIARARARLRLLLGSPEEVCG